MKRNFCLALATIVLVSCSGGDDGGENGNSSSSQTPSNISSSSSENQSSSSLEAEVLCLQNSGACVSMPLSICVQLVIAGAAQIVETCDAPLSSSSYGPSSSSIQCSDYGNGTFIDERNGIEYKYVTICTQTWMAENLNYDEDGSVCYKNEESNCDMYGRLYVWDTAKAICPEGWLLPSNDEWNVLFNFVGGTHVAGKHLKSVDGWDYFNDQSVGGLDTYGFAALPGSSCYSNGGCFGVGKIGDWWTSTEYESGLAWFKRLDHSLESALGGTIINKNDFLSVRCIKDWH